MESNPRNWDALEVKKEDQVRVVTSKLERKEVQFWEETVVWLVGSDSRHIYRGVTSTEWKTTGFFDLAVDRFRKPWKGENRKNIMHS